MRECEKILENMYHAMKKEVPDEMHRRVMRVNDLVRSVNGGELISRQVIGMMIEQFEREERARANFHET